MKIALTKPITVECHVIVISNDGFHVCPERGVHRIRF